MKRVLMWLSRNDILSPYMQWYWRRLPECQPGPDIQPLLDNIRRYGIVREFPGECQETAGDTEEKP